MLMSVAIMTVIKMLRKVKLIAVGKNKTVRFGRPEKDNVDIGLLATPVKCHSRTVW